MKFYCQPCDHRWWQHRHPDPRMRFVGMVLTIIGILQVGMAIYTIATF